MARAPDTREWYKCEACDNFSLQPMECCGQLMQKDSDSEEDQKLPPHFHIIRVKSLTKRFK